MSTENFEMYELDFEEEEEREIKLPTFIGSWRKQGNSGKASTYFINYAEAFDCVDHNKLWKILKDMGLPDHPICLMRNLPAGQEGTVRTLHGTTDWFKMWKGVF